METKICKTCLEEKNINEFRVCSNYIRGDCKFCENIKSKQRNTKNKEHIRKKQKEYRNKNKEKIDEYKKRYYNPEEKKEYNKKYREEHKEYYSNWHKEYSKTHKEQLKENYNKWKKENPNKIKRYQQTDYNKRMSNPTLKVELQLRNMIYMSFKRKKYIKNKRLEMIVGMKSSEMVEYLFQTFKKNYGYEWDEKEPVHIDHIIPLATAGNEEDVIRLCHYTNLQLLKAQDNLRKNDKLDWSLEKH